MVGGSLRFFGGFRKAEVRTRASFSLIKTVIYLFESFKVGVVVNYKGLMYFMTFQ